MAIEESFAQIHQIRAGGFACSSHPLLVGDVIPTSMEPGVVEAAGRTCGLTRMKDVAPWT